MAKTGEIKIRLLDSELFTEVIEKIDYVLDAAWSVVENPVASRVDRLEDALLSFKEWGEANG